MEELNNTNGNLELYLHYTFKSIYIKYKEVKTIHILNGDCLAEQLLLTNLNKQFIICRECLVVGSVFADGLDDFWKLRAQFISETYHISIDEYYHKTVCEFERIKGIPDGSQVVLWFENDLFCQVNMWFVLYLLSDHTNISLFRAFPKTKKEIDKWKGFWASDVPSLEASFREKVVFKEEDVELGKKLWIAYQNNDFENLKELGKIHSRCYEYLNEVIEAHIDRFTHDGSLGRPEKVVKDIMDGKSKIFNEVFSAFSSREGIYGFGDLQVKSIFDKFI